MTRYTFEVQWPVPFAQGWNRSNRRFNSTDEAANALAYYLALSADNGTIMTARLVILANEG